ncbi:MAG: hypothetical protein OXR73_21460 [Myxococcales bacterium]|nr:hypothetical protein [Myxococcales bacterium]
MIAFLAPWDERVTQVYNHALADAQRRTDVAIHHAIPVATHHHLSVTPERSNLPRFLQLLNHDVSCALNTLLANERYDQPGEVFDDRSTHTMRLVDAPAQASTLQYEYLNCAAAGLVARPEHMPGYAFNCDLWKKGYLDVRRPSSPSTAEPRHSKYSPSLSSKGTSRAKPFAIGGNDVSLSRTVPVSSRFGSCPKRASVSRILFANYAPVVAEDPTHRFELGIPAGDRKPTLRVVIRILLEADHGA